MKFATTILRRAVLTAIAFVALAASAANTDLTFRHFDASDALSEDQIRDIIQLDDSRIAIRTPQNLMLHDGTYFKSYTLDRAKAYEWAFFQNQLFSLLQDRSGLIWLKSPGYLVVFDPRQDKFIYNVDSLLKTIDVNARIDNLFLDHNRNLWFKTRDGSLLYRDRAKNSTLKAGDIDTKWLGQYGNPIQISGADSQIKVVCDKGAILNFNRLSGKFTDIDTQLSGQLGQPDRRALMLTDHSGRLWLASDRKLWRKDSPGDAWTELLCLTGASNFFTSLDIDAAGNVWAAASWAGLYKFKGSVDTPWHTGREITLESGEKIINDIQVVKADSQGGIWVGTLWRGLCYYHPLSHPFTTLKPATMVGMDVPEQSVRCLLEDTDGSILIGTSTAGVYRYLPATGRMERYRPDLLPANDIYLCLMRDSKGALWVGSYLNGFYRILTSGSVERYNYNPQSDTNISRAIYETPQGEFYASVCNNGIGRLDLTTGEIKMLSADHPLAAGHKRDYAMTPAPDDGFFIYGENGMMHFDPLADRLRLSDADASHTAVNHVITDSWGWVWAATEDGLAVTDPSSPDHGYLLITQQNSRLPLDNVTTVAEDALGQIWVSTAKGITRITRTEGMRHTDIEKYQLSNYDMNQTVHNKRFNPVAAITGRDGAIYMGGFYGVTTINPSLFRSIAHDNEWSPRLCSLSIGDIEILPGILYQGREILQRPLADQKTITLAHDQNFITLRFSGLDYLSGSQQQYRYRLTGLDNEWHIIEPGAEPKATYTSLPQGAYTFEVYSCGLDGIWTPRAATLNIKVLPPWWATWWAYCIYILIAASIIGLWMRTVMHRRERKMQYAAQEAERRRRDDLTQMKFQFFTNVSHEFRTPLALIMTPLGKMISDQPEDSDLRRRLKQIYTNAEGLLSLVNRLLDFRRLEMGGEKLNLSRCRIAQMLQLMTASFVDVSAERGIDLVLQSDIPDDTDIYIDTTKLRHIITNLFSNAIKYSPNGGQITLHAWIADDALHITVADQGVGIAPDLLPKVFDRFFQVHGGADDPIGSGIGLHLVKEYVTLHKGQISVESQLGRGTTFIVDIPLNIKTQASLPDDRIPTTAPSPADGRNTLLVVEDNEEFLEFLREYLSAGYHVVTSRNGREALDKIEQGLQPDLIVTDLMMPQIDGNTLITRLKNDLATSHIPVILLTAKATDEARIESYRMGADSYISKPFNFDILEARVKTLLDQRRQRQKQFRRDTQIEPTAVTITSLDEKIVKKALETVEANIDNTSFSTLQLGEALGLSRSQLYRKFESITGMSPADFILKMRLKRAAQLLRDSQLNVSEIADMTGFNSIKYFNKHFKAEFAMTPTEYRSANASARKS